MKLFTKLLRRFRAHPAIRVNPDNGKRVSMKEATPRKITGALVELRKSTGNSNGSD